MTSTLEWRDGLPFSQKYDDIYFSRDSGIAESRYVFLQQNNLADRWRRLGPVDGFVIGETGFGSGLNFLCAWQLWNEVAPLTARLHFVTCELHPLSKPELQRALGLWPELGDYSSLLLVQYGPMTPGWHRLTFAEGRVVLTLLVGDVADTLPRLEASVNAWFLDGFSPARNPQMWSPEILAAVADHSAPGATFATFTSAGEVRRGLAAVGFIVHKISGHGSKRDMLRGELEGNMTSPISLEREAVVIGGGMAGCASAYGLARRGWKVTLIERHATLASEASGNHQGILYARLMPRKSPLSEFTLAGYQFTLRTLAQLLPQGEDTWSQCGLLQLAFDEREATRLHGIRQLGLPEELVLGLSQAEASAHAGMQVPAGGLFFPGGGWVSPPELCRALIDSPGITIQSGKEVASILSHQGAWEMQDAAGHTMARSPVVIVACANHTLRFSQTSHLPLRSIRGQVTHIPSTFRSLDLACVICTEGYAAPSRRGLHTIGATYGNLEESIELRAADHEENLAMLSALSPDFYDSLNVDKISVSTLDGRAACRCNVVDYLPLVGSVSPDMPGLYVNTGHGSRGLVTTLLSAEVLASALTDEPLPLPSDLMAAISPGRFLSRINV